LVVEEKAANRSIRGALPQTGQAKLKGTDVKPEVGKGEHFIGTKFIFYFLFFIFYFLFLFLIDRQRDSSVHDVDYESFDSIC